MSGYVETLLVLLMINIIAAYAAYLPLAVGQLNLSIAGFMAIGAYGSAWLAASYGLPLWASIPLGMTFAGLIGLAVAVPVLRTDGIYLSLATFALGEVITSAIINTPALGGAAGMPVTGYVGIIPIAITCAVLVAIMAYVNHSRAHVILTTVEKDPNVAAMFGVDVRWTKIACFSLGAALAGLSGALLGHHLNFIEAQRFSILASIYVVLYVLLGGTQTFIGPILGAAVFTLLPEALRASGEWRYVAFAALIIVVMVWRPNGLITRETILRKGA